MKIYLCGIVVAICAVSTSMMTASVSAGGCCKRCCTPTCGRDIAVHCCHCNCGSKAPTQESSRRESASRGRSTGYVVESGPVMTYGVMPMMMPMAYGAPTFQAGYRNESAFRHESSETEKACAQLTKDVTKLSEEVDKLIKVVDKQGIAIELIVKKLQDKNILEK